MPSYKLSALAHIDLSYRESGGKLITKELADSVNAFIRNMNRVVSIYLYPVQLLILSEKFWSRWIEAREKAGCVNYDSPHYPKAGQNREGYLQERSEIAAAFQPFEWWQCHALDDDTEYPRRADIRDNFLFMVDLLAEKTGDYLANAIESMLSSVIIGTWTAFETLAEDFWVSAVNCHPADLSLLAGRRNKSLDSEKGQGRQIELNRLQEYKHDVRAVMGTILRDAKKVQFDKLETIRAAYESAFGSVAPQVCIILDSSALDDLSIVRNLFVHSAGVFDEEYKKRTKNKPHLPQATEGGSLLLNGELVLNLLNPCVDCACQLVRTIDEWITPPLLPQGDCYVI